MRTFLVGLVALLLLLPTSVHAAEGKPYQLKVVLLLARHRLLTEVLADKLQRELGDGLQAALGGMARVEVVRDHELRPRIEAVGLQRALEEWNQRSEIKTHFLLLDYADSYYRIQALQYDGITGQAGPIVRTERTRDRDFLFRLAARVIEHDFGLIGTVADNPNPSGQTTLLLDAGPGIVWDRWVKPGDVFALVNASDPTGPTELVRSAYLRVLTPPSKGDRTGACDCKVVNRFTLPNLAGYRAIKLGTTTGTLRLRLVRAVGPNTFAPLNEEMVLYLRRYGFQDEANCLRVRTDAQDTYDTARANEEGRFDRMLFLTVSNGEKVLAQVPVPLLGQSEVLIPITPGKGGDDLLRVLRDSWVRGASDAYLVQTSQMRALQKLAGQPEKRGETRKLAREALDRTRDDLARLRGQRSDLVDRATKAGTVNDLRLETADQYVQKVADAQGELQTFLTRLDEIENMEKDPKVKEARAREEQARLLERDGELGQAIALYETILGQGLDDASVQTKIDTLKRLWEPKSEEHAAARKFIYEEWPTLDTAGVLARMGDARQALAECKKVGDKLGARKLLDLTATHAVRVEKEKRGVRSVLRPEDQILVEQLNTVGEELTKLNADLVAFLGLKPEAKP